MSYHNAAVCCALLFLTCAAFFSLGISATDGDQTDIYIRADGAVDPLDAPVSTVDNVTYVFTRDIVNRSLFIERSGITVDGGWHRLVGKGALGPNATGGVRFNQVTGVTLKKVRISQSYWAISLSQSSNCAIRENDITNNSYGINVPGFCNDTVIERNRIIGNIGQGIYLYGAFNFTIRGNLVARNYPSGILARYSTDCTIVENVFAGNQGFGICADSSHNLALHHNNLINNGENAVATDYAATWDNGYPSGGNYWSDYAGVDGNYDGIGDTPYTIDAGNVDRYPFMKPLRLCLLGDVNYDGVVNILDVTILTSSYGSRKGEASWVPQADLAPPYGLIDIWDLVTCAARYKRIYP